MVHLDDDFDVGGEVVVVMIVYLIWKLVIIVVLLCIHINEKLYDYECVN